MSSFDSLLHQVNPASDPSNTTPRHNPHSVANPNETAGLFRLLQDQFATLMQDSESGSTNQTFLRSLIEALESDIDSPPTELQGVSQQYLDSLDRVNRKKLREDDSCPICAEQYLEDKYCLVVELPCHGKHRFDLECVGPWLQSKGTCPMCRMDLSEGSRKKAADEKAKAQKAAMDDDDEDDEDPAGLYG